MRLWAALSLPILASCNASGFERPPINLTQVRIVDANDPLPDDNLTFDRIDSVTVEISRVSLFSNGEFAAFGPDPEFGCLNLMPADAAVAGELGRLQDRSNIMTIPEVVHFRLVLDGVVEIPADRGSYQIMGDDFIISSAAWYRRGGEQVFLFCPAPGPRWLIHRVTKIEPI